MEVVLTFFLLTMILATATNHKLVGHNAALAVGGTIALDGLFAAPISGASMNPARSFGPALVSGQLGAYWIYVVGPFVGALFAVAVAWLLRGGTTRYAMEAAMGELVTSEDRQERRGEGMTCARRMIVDVGCRKPLHHLKG